jgi:chloramphenicol-sensitive protein RarD
VNNQRRGTLLGIAAYLIWGLFPLYWPLLEPADAIQILAHRIVWSLVSVIVLFAVMRVPARTFPRDRRRLALLCAGGVLIGINWGVYIWAVNNHHVVETSLGYFINPLVSVALGVLVLGERLRRPQWVAVAIAALGVVVLTLAAGRPPWIALSLAFSFGTYGLVKAIVNVGAIEGLVVETAALFPVALAFLAVGNGPHNFTAHGPGHAVLLMTTGAVTVAPLLAFAGAAARIPLNHLGVMFYMTPTIQFLIGILLRHEPVSAGRLAGFALVWAALAIFTVDTATNHRRQLTIVAEAVT